MKVLCIVNVGLSISIRVNPPGLWQYRYLTPDITNESLGVPTPFVYLYEQHKPPDMPVPARVQEDTWKQFKLEMQKTLGLKCSYSYLELEMQSRQLENPTKCYCFQVYALPYAGCKYIIAHHAYKD